MTAPDAATAKPSSELRKRVWSAVVLIPVALAAAWAGGSAFALFWLICGIATFWEWTNMMRVEPRIPVQVIGGAGLATLTALLLIPASMAAFAGAVALSLLVLAVMTRGAHGKLWALSGFLYAVILVLVPPIVREHPNLGLPGLLWMFAVVWSTDIAAYFTGRSLGGPKLWPRVSPKKTWSGFCGGLVAAGIAGFLVAWGVQRLGIMQPFSIRNTITLSLIASVASQLGDLGESALKRAFDVKDSSRLIPGHGGVMDRLDGFWAVALILGLVLLMLSVGSP